ncbi:MAG TPA: glycerophosphodiester phosphodiesterase family protein, partial [Rhizomicrobium sp.]|nr:glycerophosphodiester phosphodiesterase family protein [Rhizomicrobium sp.]
AALMPENSLAAFRNAMMLGADGAELDVQLSVDGVAVVYHDLWLNPGYTRRDGAWLDGETPRLKDLALAELRTFDIGRPRPGSDYARAHPDLVAVDGEHIPTLAELVALVRPAAAFRLLVELKCDLSPDSADPVALADAALRVVEEADFLSRVVFVGFDWRALARVKQVQPAAEVWCTSNERIEGTAALFGLIRGMGGQGWFPHYSQLSDSAAALARSHGLKLAAWTVNDQSEMRRLQALSVEAICTDRPDLLNSLTRHGRA